MRVTATAQLCIFILAAWLLPQSDVWTLLAVITGVLLGAVAIPLLIKAKIIELESISKRSFTAITRSITVRKGLTLFFLTSALIAITRESGLYWIISIGLSSFFATTNILLETYEINKLLNHVSRESVPVQPPLP